MRQKADTTEGVGKKSRGKGGEGGANLIGAKKTKVSQSAVDLARVVAAQSKAGEVAAAISDDLPAICMAILEGAKGRGPTAAADRSLLLRLLDHPAAAAASARRVGQEVAGSLMRKLEAAAARQGARLGDAAKVVAPVLEPDRGGFGHAGGTVGAGPPPKLPF